MKKVKWMALTMATMVLMSGCGDKKVEEFKVTEEDSTSSYVYVEQRQEVDFVDNASYMIGMSKDTKGTLHMFGMSEEEGYLHYVSDDTVSNGERSNVSWLAQEAPIDSAWVMDAKSDQEGHIVACVQNLEGETYFVGEQEDSIRKRELEINPGGFEITKNNDLLVVYNTEAVFMNWDGEELFTVEKAADPSMETQAFDICDTKFVCKNAKGDGVCIYDYESKEKINEIAYSFNPDEDVIIRMDEESHVYIANHAGIHKASMMDKEFSTICKGEHGVMGLNSSFIKGMEIEKDGTIRCLIMDFDTGKNSLYQYQRKEVSNGETLTLYTTKESEWLKKLAIEFHNAYPEYTVNIELDNDETMTQQDRVRNLNARLLNGDGPDILMLDGMPIQSYIEHGMLEDITECIQHADLIAGVKENTFAKGEVYGVATKMGVPVILDNQGEASRMKSLPALESALEKKEKVFATIGPNSAAELFATIYYDELFEENGQLNVEELNRMLHCMSLMKEQAVIGELDTYALEFIKQVKFNLTYMPVFSWNETMTMEFAWENQPLAIVECSGIDMGTLGIANKLNKNMEVFKNMYFPYAQLGIYSGSTQKEVAKKFVAFALSKEAQSVVVDDGIPVTYTGLEALTKVKNDRTSMGFELKDGTELDIVWPTEEELKEFTKLCEEVKNAQMVEQLVVSMIKSECERFLMGEASETETRERVINQVKTYWEEQQ